MKWQKFYISFLNPTFPLKTAVNNKIDVWFSLFLELSFCHILYSSDLLEIQISYQTSNHERFCWYIKICVCFSFRLISKLRGKKTISNETSSVRATVRTGCTSSVRATVRDVCCFTWYQNACSVPTVRHLVSAELKCKSRETWGANASDFGAYFMGSLFESQHGHPLFPLTFS